MSFFRPEALTKVRRYGELLIYTVVAIFGLWRGAILLWDGIWTGAVLLAIGTFAALALFGAAERALYSWRSARKGPGVVTIHEGQISFFGPDGGAIMALDALVAIDIITTERGPWADDLYWHLSDETGRSLTIPGGAEGAARLLDTLGALPGYDHRRTIDAMSSVTRERFEVWRRRRAQAATLRSD